MQPLFALFYFREHCVAYVNMRSIPQRDDEISVRQRDQVLTQELEWNSLYSMALNEYVWLVCVYVYWYVDA
jgi:hypothetical protein